MWTHEQQKTLLRNSSCCRAAAVANSSCCRTAALVGARRQQPMVMMAWPSVVGIFWAWLQQLWVFLAGVGEISCVVVITATAQQHQQQQRRRLQQKHTVVSRLDDAWKIGTGWGASCCCDP